MNFLLDTHAFLWFIGDDPALSAAARRLIESADNTILSYASRRAASRRRKFTTLRLCFHAATRCTGRPNCSNISLIISHVSGKSALSAAPM